MRLLFASLATKLTDLIKVFLRRASNRISKQNIMVDLFRTYQWSLHLHRKVFKDETSFTQEFPRCFDDIPLHELAKLIFASISRCVFYPLNILFSCLDLVFIFSTFVKIDWVVHSKWFDSLRTSLTYNCLCLRFVFVTKYTIAIIHNFQNLQIQPKVFQYSNW